MLYISHWQLVAISGVILGIAGASAVLWALEVLCGVRRLHVGKK